MVNNVVWNERGDGLDKYTGKIVHRAHPQCKRNLACFDKQRNGDHDWYFKTLGK